MTQQPIAISLHNGDELCQWGRCAEPARWYIQYDHIDHQRDITYHRESGLCTGHAMQYMQLCESQARRSPDAICKQDPLDVPGDQST